jgi:hypothetical protein
MLGLPLLAHIDVSPVPTLRWPRRWSHVHDVMSPRCGSIRTSAEAADPSGIMSQCHRLQPPARCHHGAFFIGTWHTAPIRHGLAYIISRYISRSFPAFFPPPPTATATMDFLKNLSLEDKDKSKATPPPVPTATATTGLQGVSEHEHHRHGHGLLDKLTGQHQEAQAPISAPAPEGLFEKMGTALGFGGSPPPPPLAEKEHHHHNPFHHHEEKKEGHGMSFCFPFLYYLLLLFLHL